MRANPTIKQRKFAQEYARNGEDGPAAYRHAYRTETMSDGAIRVEASRTLKIPNVIRAIEEERVYVVARAQRKVELEQEKTAVNLEWLTEKLAYLVTKAQASIEEPEAYPHLPAKTMANVMRQSIMDLGKLHGLVVDKSESKHAIVDLNEILRSRRKLLDAVETSLPVIDHEPQQIEAAE